MEIKVLGKSPAVADAGGACSGYLLRQDGYSLLMDCGTGVLAQLREVMDYGEVDTIVISHLHADHFLDLIPYSFALKYSPRAPFPRPRLVVPPGTREFFLSLGTVMRFDDQIQQVFDVQEYQQGDVVQAGPLSLHFQEVPHYIETYACDVHTPSGTRFTFGADCGPNRELQELARDTDLLAVEATSETEEVLNPDEIRGHMTAREAGQLAAAAGAKRVLITHYSDELDRDRVRTEAQAGYGGPVEMAHSGAVYVI